MKSQSVPHKLSLLQAELSDRLERIERDRAHRDQALTADFAEQAVERANDEVLDRLAESTRTELAKVRHALERLAQGEYGVCERCGGDIESERLRVLPYATTCRHCVEAPELG